VATKSPNDLRSDRRESSFQEREAVGTLHAHALYYCHLVIGSARNSTSSSTRTKEGDYTTD